MRPWQTITPCRRCLVGGLLALMLAAGAPDNGRAAQPSSGSVPESECRWTLLDEPDPAVGVRVPSQLDTHAAYAFYLFELAATQGRLALSFEGEFPFAAYMGYTIYDGSDGFLETALVDDQIVPDPGSRNPFVAGTPVNEPRRSYTVVVRPHGTSAADHPEFRNQMEMPAPTGGPSRRALDLWLRIYGPNADRDRLGGVALPRITAFDWDTLEPVGCPPRRAEVPQYSQNDGPGPAPDPDTGRIYFTRPPAYNTPFTDGSGPLDPATECTGYLAAWLGRGRPLDRIPVIHIHQLPEFWDNAAITPDATITFATTPIRYISLGSYGPTRNPDQNLAAYEMRTLADGGAVFYLVPHEFPERLKRAIRSLADKRGYNVLPMASRLRVVPPFMVYRNKVSQDDFEGSIKNVACNATPPWSATPTTNPDGSLSRFVSNPDNMGPYWVDGQECTLSDLLYADPGSPCSPSPDAPVAEIGVPPIPIPQQRHAQPVPEFIGAPTSPSPIAALPVPEHPFMAPNGSSNIHMDAYMSDTYVTGGPLGDRPEVVSSFLTGECGTATFDAEGRIITVCPGPFSTRLYLIDPATLATLATMRLPRRSIIAGAGGGAGFGAGGYFFLDQFDRAVIPTAEREIWLVELVEDRLLPRFELASVYDLRGVVPEGQTLVSALPDAGGLLWFITTGGLVGTIDPTSGAIRVRALPGEPPETISKSFAVDPVAERGGVFIVSDYALYRFDAAPDGTPEITWREPYDRGVRQKPGQIQQGSGTTPTLVGTDFVTIADNAEPQMQVLVYRRAAEIDGPRLICAVPVFQRGRSATENSLIATERSIVVENNYGYRGFRSTLRGRTTEPGIARIDLDDDGACQPVWTSAETVPNVVSQLSLADGLLYTYTKEAGPGTTDPWYFTAIDFATGRTLYKRLTGTGFLYDTHYSAVYLGADGAGYAGVAGGLVAIRDREP